MDLKCGDRVVCISPATYCDLALQSCQPCNMLCNPGRFGGTEKVKQACIKYCKEYYMENIESASLARNITSTVVTDMSSENTSEMKFIVPIVVGIIITLVILVIIVIIVVCKRRSLKNCCKKVIKNVKDVEKQGIEPNGGRTIEVNGTDSEDEQEETSLMKPAITNDTNGDKHGQLATNISGACLNEQGQRDCGTPEGAASGTTSSTSVPVSPVTEDSQDSVDVELNTHSTSYQRTERSNHNKVNNSHNTSGYQSHGQHQPIREHSHGQHRPIREQSRCVISGYSNTFTEQGRHLGQPSA